MKSIDKQIKAVDEEFHRYGVLRDRAVAAGNLPAARSYISQQIRLEVLKQELRERT